jgi:hypothetical protein
MRLVGKVFVRLLQALKMRGPVLVAAAAVCVAGCGAASSKSVTTSTGNSAPQTGTIPRGKPQAIQPVAGDAGVAASDGTDPVGDPNAHAPSLDQVRQELQMELIAVRTNAATYINPLRYVTVWGRTDQGVDAAMPVGAPILAPCKVKILAIIPNWFAGQPLVYYELLEGPQAGKIQYVAEQITAIAPAGTILQQGQPIARYAASGTNIEFGWSTINGVTLAMATSGYTEGQVTPAGRSIRDWLNALGANAGHS